MKKIITLISLICLGWFAAVSAEENVETISDMFRNGETSGSLRSYYFTQTFDDDGTEDSAIWAYGGNLKYVTGQFYGVKAGANVQGSFIGYKDDEDNKTAGSMDAHGAVLSEAYLEYQYDQTRVKGGRQYVKLPLIAGSGSRLIHESFESYLLTNGDIPGTQITAGWVRKYQTRTDKSNYSDNWFVDFETNGTGDPGDFYKIGDNGMYLLHLTNNLVPNLEVQVQYANVVDEVAGFYGDAKYQFDTALKPYVAGQYYYTDYDDSGNDNNYLYGLKTGIRFHDVDLFAGLTSAGGSEGDARVFRGVGQGAYYQYTATTKTAGVGAFEAGTDAYQLGIGYKYKDFSGKLRFTDFDNPAADADLREYTLNLFYNLGGFFKGLTASADFSVLDYENDSKDATDLRTRVIWEF
tara:strand:+ start:2249 stop:3472 length:1224 start_codon:yes stop_codon:yes gene_type:complete